MNTELEQVALLIDNPFAPEVFCAEAIGFLNHGGNIHITMVSPKPDHSKSPTQINKVVIARLVMPVAGAQALAAGLYNFLQTQGLDPVPMPEKSKLQ